MGDGKTKGDKMITLNEARKAARRSGRIRDSVVWPVVLEVGARTDGYRYTWTIGSETLTSRVYHTPSERRKALDFVFGAKRWSVADERIGDF